MLKTMRENTKVVLWIVLVAFLGGFVVIALGTGVRGCGDLARSFGIKIKGRAPDIVGMVNGLPVTYEFFQREYGSLREVERERLGSSFSDDQRTMQQLRERTWDGILQRLLFLSRAEELGISVSPKELAEYIVNNPPQWIVEHPQLQTDGRFDRQKYLQALQGPGGLGQMVEAQYAELLPVQKLQGRVNACIRTTRLEIERELQREADHVEATYLAVRDYPFRSATKEDRDRTLQLAEELASSIASPLDFARAAETHSFGAKASEGGRYGRVTEGTRGAAVDSILFSMELNTCSRPIELGSSWFLFLVHERGEDESGAWADISQIMLNVTRRVDDAALAKYFRDHRAEYRNPEKAKVRLVTIAKEASDRDETDIREEIEVIREEIIEGRPFEEVAALESEDAATAEQGGDLGEFGRGKMVPEFEEVAFSLDSGTISEPVRTQFGWHLIRVDERSTVEGEEQLRARHILLKVEPGQATLDSMDMVMESVAEDARRVGLEEAARLHGLEATETAPFPRGSYIPGLGASPGGAAWVFQSSPGDVSRALETDRDFFVLETVERVPEREAKLSEVRGRVVMAYLREKAAQEANEYMKGVAQRLKDGESFQAVTSADTLVELLERIRFARKDYASGVGRDIEPVGAAFGLERGMAAGPLQGSQASLIVRCDSLWSDAVEDTTGVTDRVLMETRQRVFTSWLKWLEEDAIIEDYRENFFGIS